MAILKFRVYFEEDDSIYRDIAAKHTQSFFDFHLSILKSFEFDSKHQATFYRSNDKWLRGREISLEKYDKSYKVDPLIMTDTTIGSEIRNPNEKFVYVYDFTRNWSFLVELINVSKEENAKLSYPALIRSEGIAPSQYGTKSVLGDRFVDVEEKYDLSKGIIGFTETGGDKEDIDTGDTDTETEAEADDEDESAEQKDGEVE